MSQYDQYYSSVVELEDQPKFDIEIVQYGDESWFKSPEVQREIQLSCDFRDLPEVFDFSCEIFYKVVRSFENRPDLLKEFQELLKPDVEVRDGKKILNKGGFEFNRAMFNRVYNIIQYNTLESFTTFARRNAEFETLMGAFYTLTMDDSMIARLVGINPVLQETFMQNLRTVYCLPESYTYQNYYDDTDDLVWSYEVIFYILTMFPPRSNLVTTPLNNAINRIPVGMVSERRKHHVAIPPSELSCHKYIDPKVAPDYLAVGSEWYAVPVKSFFNKCIAERYKRPILAGASGSSLLLTNFVFNIFRVREMNSRNVMLLLKVIIAQYVPLYHTLTEVLLAMSDILPQPYYVDEDPVNYVRALDKLVKPLSNAAPAAYFTAEEGRLVDLVKKAKELYNFRLTIQGAQNISKDEPSNVPSEAILEKWIDIDQDVKDVIVYECNHDPSPGAVERFVKETYKRLQPKINSKTKDVTLRGIKQEIRKELSRLVDEYLENEQTITDSDTGTDDEDEQI